MPSAIRWVDDRRTHSITDDAFVEAHIVNVAPQMVSGRIVRFLADENDQVVQGQILAEIDPIPYRDKVNLARPSSIQRSPSWTVNAPTSTAFARKFRSRSRSPDGPPPPPWPIGPG